MNEKFFIFINILNDINWNKIIVVQTKNWSTNQNKIIRNQCRSQIARTCLASRLENKVLSKSATLFEIPWQISTLCWKIRLDWLFHSSFPSHLDFCLLSSVLIETSKPNYLRLRKSQEFLSYSFWDCQKENRLPKLRRINMFSLSFFVKENSDVKREKNSFRQIITLKWRKGRSLRAWLVCKRKRKSKWLKSKRR